MDAMKADNKEKKVKKKKKEKKRKEKTDTMNVHDKEKTDAMNGDDKEKMVEKKKEKKRKEKTDAMYVDDNEKKVEKKRKEKTDAMNGDDKEKVAESKKKEKTTKDDVIAGDEEHKKKLKEKKKNVKGRGNDVEEGKETIDNHSGNKAESLENRRDAGGKAKTTKKRDIAADSSKHDNPPSKKVTFSDELKVFPPPDKEGGLVQGKRFSKEEDEMIIKSVSNYIERYHLGEEGLKMVLHCRSHPKVKNCWREIGEALPWRPYVSVYNRAHILYERGERRKWTPEEEELLRKSHEIHGDNYKHAAEELGRSRVHVKDKWRQIKLPNAKRGSWSQDEYQTLFGLVHKELQMKVFEEKISKHGMIRDNIGWEAISETMQTRHAPACSLKWYAQLSSPMVVAGIWADADDYRLLMELVDLDAGCEEEVDWHNLLEYRSGDLCRRRWQEMVNHIGVHGTKSFPEQVEVLSQRYCSDMLEVREAVDARPMID